MRAEQFMRAISDADFQSLLGDRLSEFEEFVELRELERKSRIVIRFLMERIDGDNVYTPYYVWAIYPMHVDDGVLEILPPDFSDATTYLRTPKEVEDEPFFEVAIL